MSILGLVVVRNLYGQSIGSCLDYCCITQTSVVKEAEEWSSCRSGCAQVDMELSDLKLHGFPFYGPACIAVTIEIRMFAARHKRTANTKTRTANASLCIISGNARRRMHGETLHLSKRMVTIFAMCYK